MKQLVKLQVKNIQEIISLIKNKEFNDNYDQPNSFIYQDNLYVYGVIRKPIETPPPNQMMNMNNKFGYGGQQALLGLVENNFGFGSDYYGRYGLGIGMEIKKKSPLADLFMLNLSKRMTVN